VSNAGREANDRFRRPSLGRGLPSSNDCSEKSGPISRLIKPVFISRISLAPMRQW